MRLAETEEAVATTDKTTTVIRATAAEEDVAAIVEEAEAGMEAETADEKEEVCQTPHYPHTSKTMLTQ